MRTRSLVLGVLTTVIAIYIGYSRWSLAQIKRSRTAGSRLVQASALNNTQSYRFTVLSKDTNHAYSEMEYISRINGPCNPKVNPLPFDRPCTPPPHIHLDQTETFTVLSGSMSYLHADLTTPRHAKVGESVVVRPGTPHAFWNDSPDQDLKVTIRLEPAPDHQNEQFFETVSGLNRDLECSGKVGCGHPSLWHIFVLFDYGGVVIGDTSLPLPVLKVVSRVLGFVGRVLGYSEYYSEYSQPW